MKNAYFSLLISTQFKVLMLALLALSGVELKAQSPTVQDCLGAIPICTDTITIPSPYAYSGNGNYLNEILSMGGCYTTEANGVWFSFTVQTSGLLRFVLSPHQPNTDIDWILFDMTNTSCAALSTVNVAAAFASSNNWGVWGVNGDVGISTANGGIGNCNGPGNFNGPKWNADLPVVAGEEYVLYVSNWSNSTSGFGLDFSASTASIYDDIPPKMDSISSSVNCQTFDSIRIQFDENVMCNSLQAGDFKLTGPGGNHVITSVNAIGCNVANTMTNEVSIHFFPAVTQVGNYTLEVKSGAGYIEDLCGNLDTLDSIEFTFDGVIETELSAVHLECFNECEGEIEVDVIGGVQPFSYDWSGGLPNNASQTGVCAGLYTLTLTDDVGCEVIDTITVQQPADIATALISSLNVSCPGTSNCDGGAQVSASGGVSPYAYLWSSNESSNIASALCEGLNDVTVTDANGCKDTFAVLIGVPDSIETEGAGDTLICIGNVTSVAAAATGGTPPFNYIWHEHSLTGAVVSTSQVFQVSPDTTTSYFVETFDDRGCVGDTSMVTVKVRQPLGLILPHVDTICPYDTIIISVQGTGGDSNYTYAWSTGDFGAAVEISPDAPTWFVVTVSDACGTPAFTDSVFVQVGGYTPIKATIRVEDDSICAGESLYLIASGRFGFNGSKEFSYEWSHTEDGNPVQFVQPTTTRTYAVTITDLCLSEPGVSDHTVFVGRPEMPHIKATPEEACENAEVQFKNLNYNEKSHYLWEFGDGDEYDMVYGDSVYHFYSEPGCYDVSLNVTTEFGCESFQKVPCLVNILEQPIADFDYNPSNPTNKDPFVSILNKSISADNWFWVIGNDTIMKTDKIVHEFNEFGADSVVSLFVTSKDGCSDTISRNFPTVYETLIYYPKSFSPNGDGLNDVFEIKGEAVSMEGYSLEIFDRWGHVLFKSTDPTLGWNGKQSGGELVPVGTYPFVMRYRDHQNQDHLVRDHIIVSKSGNKTGLR